MNHIQKSAQELGLPSGDAVMRDGKVTILPADHQLDTQRRPTDVGPATLPVANIPSTAHVEIKSSYKDRSDGFRIATAPVSIAMAIVGLLVGAIGWQVPVASMAILPWLFGFFCATWGLAFFWHLLVSPDGTTFATALIHGLGGLWIVKREQDHRFGRKQK